MQNERQHGVIPVTNSKPKVSFRHHFDLHQEVSDSIAHFKNGYVDHQVLVSTQTFRRFMNDEVDEETVQSHGWDGGETLVDSSEPIERVHGDKMLSVDGEKAHFQLISSSSSGGTGIISG